MLTVESLSVTYGRITALREVSLSVARGEIVTLVGANGAGKSSLLNAIAGAAPVSAGRIALRDTTISRLPAHSIARMGIAFVPEGRQLMSEMSVIDNLLLGSYVRCSGNWRRLLGPSRGLLQDAGIHRSLDRVFS
ncbi:MAG TPA: ATP-binding cassette domain-containing protein, partial [Chloroflexota bacterium]